MSQILVTGEAKIRDLQGPVVANSGVITALDGAANQYVRGDGTLASFPTSGGGGSSVSYYLNGSVNQGTIGGVAYKELSKDPILGVGTDFTISANGYVASFITDANDPDSIIVPGGNWNTEIYFSVDSNSNSPYFYVEVYKYDGSTFTLLGSNQTTPEYITAGTTITPYYGAVAIPTTNTAITDRIAIRIYVVPDGRTVTLHTENSHLGQIVTTFSKGMTSLNNLTDQSQYLTTGTSGTDFNIASSGDTHTFNLPVASATNTGKLSSTDWSTFNNKVPYTGATADVDLGLYELSAQNAFLNGVSGVNGGNLFLKQGDDFGQSSGYTSLYSSGKNLGILSYVGSHTYNAFISLALIPNNETRSYILPNQSGTFALLDGAQTFTGANTFAGGVISIADSNAASYILRGRFTDDLAQIQFKNNAATNTKAKISVYSVGTNGGAMQFLVKPDGLPEVSSLILSSNQADFETSVTSTGSFTGTSLRILNSTFTATLGASLTANRTITIPDITGTIALLEGTQTFSGAKTFSATTLLNTIYVDGVSYLKHQTTTSYIAGYTTYSAKANGVIEYFFPTSFKSVLDFNDAADYTYTFPSASGTIALTSDLGGYVTLATTQTISGAKTFSLDITVNGVRVGKGASSVGGNTVVGEDALISNTGAGTGNTAIGYASLNANTSGGGNTGIGNQALVRVTTGSYNIGIGLFAGENITVGNNNTIIGNYAGTAGMVNNIVLADGLGNVRYQWNGTNNVFGNPISGTSATFSSSVTAGDNITITAATGNSPLRFTSTTASSKTGYLYADASIIGITDTLNAGVALDGIFFNSTTKQTLLFNNGNISMALTSAGNVGIGTSSPQTLLSVQTSGDQNVLSPIITSQTSSVTYTGIYSIRDGAGDQRGLSFQVYTANVGLNEKVRITSGGFVGIGTSSPVVLLQGQISSTSNTDTEIFRLTDGVLCDFKIRLKRGTTSDNSTSVVNTYSGIMAFETGNTERMRITSGGDVGIGTSTIAFAAVNRKCLEVNGAGTSLIALKVADAAQGYIYSIGNNGDFYLARVGTGGNLIIQNNSGGAYLSPGATSWSAVSDIRLKNINSNIDNALDKLMTLSTINFSWKSDETKQENLGFIAQEVEKVFPQVITKVKINGNLDSKIEDDTEYLSVKYTDLIPVLVKAIQEQQAQIEELKELIKNK